MTEPQTGEPKLHGWRMSLDRFARAVERTLDAVLAIMLAVLVASLVWQVFGRYVLDHAPSWSEELSRFLMVWVSMLGSAVVMREHGHINIAVLVDAVPPAVRSVLLAIRDGVVLATVYVLFVYGLDLATLLKGQLSAAFEISMAIPYAALPVGGLLIGIAVVVSRLTRSPYARGIAAPLA